VASLPVSCCLKSDGCLAAWPWLVAGGWPAGRPAASDEGAQATAATYCPSINAQTAPTRHRAKTPDPPPTLTSDHTAPLAYRSCPSPSSTPTPAARGCCSAAAPSPHPKVSASGRTAAGDVCHGRVLVAAVLCARARAESSHLPAPRALPACVPVPARHVVFSTDDPEQRAIDIDSARHSWQVGAGVWRAVV
jgi:hypothetical protein